MGSYLDENVDHLKTFENRYCLVIFQLLMTSVTTNNFYTFVLKIWTLIVELKLLIRDVVIALTQL